MNPQAELIVLPRQTPLGPLAALLACVGWLWGGVSLRAADPFETAAISRATTWTNSLGMKLVPVRGTDVLFSVWETRVQDYAAFAGAHLGVDRGWEDPGYAQRTDHPVVQVSWRDAQAFCRWLTEKERAAGFIDPSHRYRLPMDAEWSVAVGLNEPPDGTPATKDGKIRGVYPWGTQWPPPDRAGNYDDHSGLKITGFSDGYPRTSPVGSFAANAFGLFDLGGNVWEWCEDGYDERQKYRVLRGASWDNNDPEHLFSTDRGGSTPEFRHRYNGFRCVLAGVGPATPPSREYERKASAESAAALAHSEFQRMARMQALLEKSPVKPALTNSLGMLFVPVPRTTVVFCMFETRVRDYEVYAMASPGVAVEWKNPGFAQGEDHPVVNVSWEEAKAFCEWLSRKEGRTYRLPTDAEWSVAVGLNEPPDGTPATKDGKIRSVYPWGRQWPPPDRAGNYDQHSRRMTLGWGDGFEGAAPVGSFPANAFGLFDLGGNVWEWCEDGYDGDQRDRVLRGASWDCDNSGELLSSNRHGSAPDFRSRFYGFRCVLAGGGSAR